MNTKKSILFVILDQFADWETAYLASAVYLLGEGKYEIKTVSLAKDTLHSIGGLCAIPDYDLESVPEDYEAVILIGAMTWRNDESKKIKALVDDCLNKRRVLAGICDGTTFLGTLGVLNHVNHTCNSLQDLKDWAGNVYTGEAYYLPQQTVRDGNIITAKINAPLDFAREVLMAIHLASEETINEWYQLHSRMESSKVS